MKNDTPEQSTQVGTTLIGTITSQKKLPKPDQLLKFDNPIRFMPLLDWLFLVEQQYIA